MSLMNNWLLKKSRRNKVMDAAVPAPLLQRAAGLEPVHPAVFPMSVPAEPGPDKSTKQYHIS